jgi:hypothetical protein
MTLILAIKVKAGLVLAADSRRNLEWQIAENESAPSYLDDATKLLAFKNEIHAYVGVLTYGAAIIGDQMIDKLLSGFEAALPSKRTTIDKYAQKLTDFFMANFGDERESRGLPRNLNISEETPPSATKFLVAGFDTNEYTGRVYRVTVPYHPTQIGYLPGNEELLQEKCGIVCGGESNTFNQVFQKLLSRSESEQTLPADCSWGMPGDISLLKAVELACDVMEQSKRLNDKIGGPIHISTITMDEGLKKCRCPSEVNTNQNETVKVVDSSR